MPMGPEKRDWPASPSRYPAAPSRLPATVITHQRFASMKSGCLESIALWIFSTVLFGSRPASPPSVDLSAPAIADDSLLAQTSLISRIELQPASATQIVPSLSTATSTGAPKVANATGPSLHDPPPAPRLASGPRM